MIDTDRPVWGPSLWSDKKQGCVMYDEPYYYMNRLYRRDSRIRANRIDAPPQPTVYERLARFMELRAYYIRFYSGGRIPGRASVQRLMVESVMTERPSWLPPLVVGQHYSLPVSDYRQSDVYVSGEKYRRCMTPEQNAREKRYNFLQFLKCEMFDWAMAPFGKISPSMRRAMREAVVRKATDAYATQFVADNYPV